MLKRNTNNTQSTNKEHDTNVTKTTANKKSFSLAAYKEGWLKADQSSYDIAWQDNLWNQLIVAIVENQEHTALKLAKQISNKELFDKIDKFFNMTALMLAASKGHKEVCELLIKASPKSANAVNEYGDTALMAAAHRDHKEVCELLISKMSQKIISAVTREGTSALKYAEARGHTEIVTLLESFKDEAQTINKKFFSFSPSRSSSNFLAKQASNEEVLSSKLHSIKSSTSTSKSPQEFQKEIEYYDNIIKLNSTSNELAAAYYNEALILRTCGKNKEALECCNAAIKFNPGEISYYLDKGQILNELNRPVEATECFNLVKKIAKQANLGPVVSKSSSSDPKAVNTASEATTKQTSFKKLTLDAAVSSKANIAKEKNVGNQELLINLTEDLTSLQETGTQTQKEIEYLG